MKFVPAGVVNISQLAKILSSNCLASGIRVCAIGMAILRQIGSRPTTDNFSSKFRG